MPTGDTIAALASPPGPAPRALIRLSGPATREAIGRLCGPRAWGERGIAAVRLALRPNPSAGHPPGARQAPDGPRASVPALLLRLPGPGSYTGEDSAELLVPGQPALADRVLAAVLAQPGVRPADPGEFTARAYLAGKLTLAEAEGVAAVIAADREAELAAGARLLAGEAGAECAAWADRLATLLALVEAGIDFTEEEDVVAIGPTELQRAVRELAGEIERRAGPRAVAEHTAHRPTVALVGPPNAGKSTLFNALLRRQHGGHPPGHPTAEVAPGADRAVAADLAGTTRDVLREPLPLHEVAPGLGMIDLLDLPGLDAEPRPPRDNAPATGADTDTEAQRSAAQTAREADVLIVCDPAGRFEIAPGLAEQAADGPAARPIIRVRTKCDLPAPAAGPTEPAGHAGTPPPDRAPRRSAPEHQAPPGRAAPLGVCALDGWNLGPLVRAIADAVSSPAGHAAADTDPSPRRRRLLRLAAEHLAAAGELTGPADRTPSAPEPELVAHELRSALDAIGELAGRITPDDIIGRVFATFCVGK